MLRRARSSLARLVQAAIPYATFATLVLACLVFLLAMASFWTKESGTRMAIASLAASIVLGGGLVYIGYAQLRHAKVVLGHTETVRMLDMMPVLTPWFIRDHVLKVDNCGRGPAMDIRATVCRPRRSDPMGYPLAIFGTDVSRSHLGPEDDSIEISTFATPVLIEGTHTYKTGNARDTDVWIIHCGDQNGLHWHAWCNWTRREEGGQYRDGEPFIFERDVETPAWIRRYCPRCPEIDRLRRGESPE